MADIRNANMKVGVVTTILIGVVGFAVAYNSRIQSIETNSKQCQHDVDKNTERIAGLELKDRERELQNIEIKTKLTSIETSLIEIKQALKEHSARP